jgi:hypothetical protein
MDAYEYRNRAAACARAIQAAPSPSMKNMFRALQRQWTELAERADRSALYAQTETADTPLARDRTTHDAHPEEAIERP